MYTVTGRIYGSGSSDGLSNASVTVVGTTQGVSTSANGSFALVVPSAATMIKISHLGYIDRIMTAGSFNQFETLDSKNEQFEEVVINATQKKDKTLLYVGIGAVALVTAAIIISSKNAPQKVRIQ